MISRPLVAATLATSIVGCLAGPAPSATPSVPRDTATPAATPRPRPAVATVTTVARGLEAPWAVAVAPDGRIFVTERPGRIRVIANGALALRPWLVLDVVSQPDREMGLLGLALDPDFASTGYVYVHHTYAAGGQLFNRLVRLREVDGRGTVDRVLIDRIPGNARHDGARLVVGPDGRLYVTTGDAERPQNAQDPSSLAGKVLRVERDGAVPADNPTRGSYVFTLGHRHPQGLAFAAGGRLYATEHGPSGNPARGEACCHDEVNLLRAGGNYGWPVVFGAANDARFVDPIAQSGDDTWAPSGATYLTSGPHAGSLLFAALRGAHLHRLVFAADGRTVTFEERFLEREYGRLRDVVEAPDGSLLVLTSNRDGRGRPAADDDRVLRVVLR